MALCPHKQNPLACIQCFSKPKPVPSTAAPRGPQNSAGAQTILDRIKERGAPSPAPRRPVPQPGANPHAKGDRSGGGEKLMEFPEHRSIIDSQSRHPDSK